MPTEPNPSPTAPESDPRAETIRGLQEIVANLPAAALPHFISAVYKLGHNAGEWAEYCRQGEIRDADFMSECIPVWVDDQTNENAKLHNHWSGWTDSALAWLQEHHLPPPPAPDHDGDPGYRDPDGKIRRRPR